LLSGGGCGLVDANVLTTEIHLQTQTYQQNFGTATGTTVPSVPCTAQQNTCQQLQPLLTSSDVTALCDGTACYAEANVTLTYTVNLSMDAAFQSSVGQKLVQAVQGIDLAYGLPTNTLTFEIPELDLYVGPQNATAVTSQGVVQVGTIGPFAAGVPVKDGSLHLTLDSTKPAWPQLVSDIMSPNVPFVFLISTSASNPPKIMAGDAVPAGQVQLDVLPTITVGID
jgi:hypothetical protein